MVATVVIGACLSLFLFADAAWWAGRDVPVKTVFSPGPLTDGHYQIEERCDLCHTPFNGVRQQACLDCHREELVAARDTHAADIFAGPHARDLARLDARVCITCHTEHQPEIESRGGVTVSDRFCMQCHERITRNSASHVGLTFDMCTGCHNYHDNRVLDPAFRHQHVDMPDLLAEPRVLLPAAGDQAYQLPLSRSDADMPEGLSEAEAAITEWELSAHAAAGVNCMDCHVPENNNWQQVVSHEICANCHARATSEFLRSRKGMRLAHALPALSPAGSRLPMHEASDHLALNCSGCHAPHGNDTPELVVETCLTCHDSRHSNAYIGSPHHLVWQAEVSGKIEKGAGVSCATCHFPSEKAAEGHTHAVHNPNRNLRPNEKMIETVCMQCHGLEYSLEALTDWQQIQENFRSPPIPRIFSIQNWLALPAPLRHHQD